MFGKRISSSETSAHDALIRGIYELITSSTLSYQLTEWRTTVYVHNDDEECEIHRQFFMRPTGEFIMLMVKFNEDDECWNCMYFRNACSALPDDYDLHQLSMPERIKLRQELDQL